MCAGAVVILAGVLLLLRGGPGHNSGSPGAGPGDVTPSSAPVPLLHAKPTWSDGFESGDFSGWSWWGQGVPNWGHVAVVDPAAERIPPASGGHVARFETTREDVSRGIDDAKIFRIFGAGSGPARKPPKDVSGTYRVIYYFPKTYRVPNKTYVNAFQFKEKWHQGGGIEGSRPLWWINLGNAAEWRHKGGPAPKRADAPVAFINREDNDWKRSPRVRAVPLGRWVEFRAEVVQGKRIDFYVDGHLLETARASEYPVSPFRGRRSIQWEFGVGNYSGGANGPMYADDGAFVPRR
jgi:hypothetical protein